jgi:hypothetical protein
MYITCSHQNSYYSNQSHSYSKEIPCSLSNIPYPHHNKNIDQLSYLNFSIPTLLTIHSHNDTILHCLLVNHNIFIKINHYCFIYIQIFQVCPNLSFIYTTILSYVCWIFRHLLWYMFKHVKMLTFVGWLESLWKWITYYIKTKKLR